MRYITKEEKKYIDSMTTREGRRATLREALMDIKSLGYKGGKKMLSIMDQMLNVTGYIESDKFEKDISRLKLGNSENAKRMRSLYRAYGKAEVTATSIINAVGKNQNPYANALAPEEKGRGYKITKEKFARVSMVRAQLYRERMIRANEKETDREVKRRLAQVTVTQNLRINRNGMDIIDRAIARVSGDNFVRRSGSGLYTPREYRLSPLTVELSKDGRQAEVDYNEQVLGVLGLVGGQMKFRIFYGDGSATGYVATYDKNRHNITKVERE